MIERSIKRIRMRALMVDDELPTPTAEGHAARALVQELQGRAIDVVEAASAEDGMSVVVSDSAIHALLLDWTLGSNGEHDHEKARALLEFVRSRNDKVPIFLMAERGAASSIPIDVMEMVDEYVWTLEDTAAFVGGRVVASIRRYLEVMMPPLAAAVMKFSQEYEYSWHTPGHTGGTAFLKSPVGRMFFDYFGENLLRSDRGARVRGASDLFGHQRHLDVEPGDLHGRRGARPDRPVRPQLSQVHRAQSGDDRRHPDLPGPGAQPLRHHWSHPSRAAYAGGDQGGDQGEPPRHERDRDAARPFDHHELHLRWAVLQRTARGGAARPERGPDPL